MNNYFFSIRNEIKNKINLVLYFSILLYIVSLFIQEIPVVTNCLIAVIVALSFFSVSNHTILQRFSSSKVNIGILVFFFYQLLSVLLSTNLNAGFNILIFRLPLFLLPLSFCFIDFDKKIWDRVLVFYAITTFLASIVGFLFGCYKAILGNDTGFLYNDNISMLLGKQSVYFAYYVAIAIVIVVLQLKQNNVFVQSNKVLFSFSIVWLFFILFMLASRTTMFTLLIIFFVYVAVQIFQKKKYLEGVLLLLSLLVSLVLISRFFPKALNRLKGTTEFTYRFDNKNVENHFNATYDPEKWNGTNTRVAIWTCVIDIWKEHPIIGTGLGDRNDELMKKYEEKKFWYALTTQKNTHNQYLDVLLSMGIVGLVLFLFFFFIFPFQYFIKNKQLFPLLVFILLASAFFTENMLDRYQGLVFISWILPLSVKIK